MKKYKHLKYEEKYLLLKNHFQSGVKLDLLVEEFGVRKSTIYNWFRKIDYDFENIERLRNNHPKRERRSRI